MKGLYRAWDIYGYILMQKNLLQELVKYISVNVEGKKKNNLKIYLM